MGVAFYLKLPNANYKSVSSRSATRMLGFWPGNLASGRTLDGGHDLQKRLS